MSAVWIAALPEGMRKAVEEFRDLVGQSELDRLYRIVVSTKLRDDEAYAWMQELYHERMAGTAEEAEALRARIAALEAAMVGQLESHRHAREHFVERIAALELEADGNARAELERAHAAGRAAKLSQILASLMMLEVRHQTQPGSATCWANCAKCRLDAAKREFTKLGGTEGGP